MNRDEIGILGICGWGGMALNAAISDTRIKAVATSTMYDMTRVMANGYEINMKQNAQGGYDRAQPQMDAAARYKLKEQLNNNRWEGAQNGYATLASANNLDPEKDITADTPKFIAEYADFYRTEPPQEIRREPYL